jgi:rubrerythrin
MELGAILLILALSALVALFVAQPFLERRAFKMVSAEEHTSSSLMAERDRLIGALQELDFDHTLGKIPAEDYPVMRAQLLAQAADVLRTLDELTPSTEKGKLQKNRAEERVEAEVAARREDAAIERKAKTSGDDDDIEEMLAARRAARKEKTAGFCSKCGKPLMKSDKFCPACGNPT